MFIVSNKSIAQAGICGLVEEDTVPLKGNITNSILSSSLNITKTNTFPTSGNINALVVFIKFKDRNYEDLRTFTGYNQKGEPEFSFTGLSYSSTVIAQRDANFHSDSWTVGGLQSWTDDPETEWPANLPMINAQKQQLPAWGNDFIDDFDTPHVTTNGSMTDFLYKASNGKINFRGKVYEWTYVPEFNSSHYNDMTVLTQEILNYIRNDSQTLIDIDDVNFDLIESNSANHGSDGFFDMLMLNFRDINLDVLDSYWSNLGFAGGITYLHPYQRSNFKNGNYHFNRYSGVINSGYSKYMMMGTAIHEIGHRLFGKHPTESFSETSYFDNFSIMNKTPVLRFHISVRDRLVAGWANIKEIDISNISQESIHSIYESYRINTVNEHDIIILRNGNSYSGAIAIEGLHKNQPWLIKPIGIHNDGDGTDVFLPNEGLLIYKLDNQISKDISSIHANGNRRFYTGINDFQAFGNQNQYTPFTIVKDYKFIKDSILDNSIAITDIVKTSTGFTFKVHKNFLTSETNKNLYKYISFNKYNIADTSSWELGGRFYFNENIDISNFDIEATQNNDWNGFVFNDYNGQFNISNATIAELKGDPNWSLYPGEAVISIKHGNVTFDNVNIHSNGVVPAIGATGSNGILTITNSDIHTQQGTGILSTGNGIVYVRNTEISSSSNLNPLVVTKFGGYLGAWIPPWLSLYYADWTGYNKLQGGLYGLDASGSSIIRFGEGYGSNSFNQFLDSYAKKITVSSGGIAYVKYDYWYEYSPTQINNGGIIYYSNSMGGASGTILGSGGFMQTNTSNDDKLISSKEKNTAISNSLADMTAWETVQNEKASKQFSNNKPSINLDNKTHFNAKQNQLYYLYKQIEANGISNLEVSELNSKHLKLDNEEKSHLIYTAIQSSLSMGDTNNVRSFLSQNFIVSKYWKPVFNTLKERLDIEIFDEFEITSKNVSSLSIYPNPFNPSTTIQFIPNQSGELKISVFNSLGQKVLEMKSLVKEAQVFKHSYDASNLASGMYLLQLQLGENTYQSKLFLVK